MKEPVRALYRILVCAILLVIDIKASDDLQINVIDLDSEELNYPIQNRGMNSLSEHLDNSQCNFASFVLTQTEKIRTAHYSGTPSSNTEVHKYDTDQPKENTEQTSLLPSFYSTVCGSSTECPLVCCIPNESVQKHTEFESLRNYKQPSKAKRPKNTIEKNTPRKKQKKTNENTLDSDSTDNDELDSSKINRTKKNISIWNNSRLKNRHREGQYVGYRPAVAFNKFGYNKYKEIGDEKHQSLIETHVKHCKAVYSKILVQNEFWFAIASRNSCLHTKHADCQAINENPLGYKFIEELSGYYPGLPGDIVKYMDTHGPIVSKQESIKTDWNETLGDIYVRKPAKSEYAIGKETISYETCKEYRPVATAVRMILGLPEVHKDLSNHTAKFIEKTLEEETDSNHLTVVRALHKIVAKYKSSNKLELDGQYIILYNVFANILYKIYVSYESMVVQLYSEMYKSLVYFYEKAEVCEEILEKKRRMDGKEYYLLAGKCIIKPQRYLKCTTIIDLNKKDIYEYTHQITEEANKWSISPDIHNHYHIHYVDNTKQQYTRVCMPMCLGPIHTISQTIEYLKKIHNIEKDRCICPYTRNQFGYWECIGERERNKTVNGFTYCDVVFYYIEEGLKENYFTFAEFESYVQPKGKTICIPLFLSPLMRSAVSMGPFEERDMIKHKLVDSMQSMCLQPSVYVYKKEYKAIEYSHVHHYYSNLYIRRDNADVPTVECHIMDSQATIDNGTAIVEWYAKVPNSVDKYTHCILSDNLTNVQDKYSAFSKAIKSREYTPDSALYGFGLQSSLEKTSMLDGVGYSTNDPIDPNSIANCKLSIAPIHKTSTNPKIADLQSEIDELDRDIKQIGIMIKEPETTEEQKEELNRKRNSIYTMKSRSRKKLKKIQPEDQLLIEEEIGTIPLPSCASFLVFRRSNTQTKSSLGAHNEILDALTRRYNPN